jgi:hypothetical protein
MEPEATLVWAKSRVELNAETIVDLEGTRVIFPDNPELDDPFGNRDHFERNLVFGVLLEEGRVFE